VRNAKLVFRNTVVIDAAGSGIHLLPGPQSGAGRRSRKVDPDV
jgi:hypothetical protein